MGAVGGLDLGPLKISRIGKTPTPHHRKNAALPMTECVESELSKCGGNMDANKECKELFYYFDMRLKLSKVKEATVKAG